MANRELGERDLPLEQTDKDLLNTKKYINALVEFTKRCCTPMAIALQGDWGTGKTSFINHMRFSLDSENQDKNQKIGKKIHTMYFNTWQYSQFNSPEDLYTSFVACLIQSLANQSEKSEEIKNKGWKFFGVIAGIGIDVVKQLVKDKSGYDLSKAQIGIEDATKLMVDHLTKKNNTITDLKKNFSDLISEVAGENGRVIVFIDDLDRLNPEVAVALLETIKLFMDVPKCVFVLAIDYDVVVRGIKKKYGNDMDDEKCRSFFDKIIQLPFRMPTEKYMIDTMILNSSAGNKIKDYVEIISNLIKNSLGPNPRTLKRLINSFELLSLVDGSEKKDYQNALLLISLIMQIYDEKEYIELIDNVDSPESLVDYSNSKEIEQKDVETKEREKKHSITPFFEAVKKVGEKCEKTENEIYEEFIKNLTLSAMTTVSAGSGSLKSESAIKIDKITVYESEKDVKNPTEAFTETVKIILEKNKDRIDEIIQKNNSFLSTDNDKEKSKFRVKKSINIDEIKIYIGTNSNTPTKIDDIKKLCKCLELSDGTVKWYYNNEEKLWT